MDATGHAALTHVLHDASLSVIKQLRAQLQEKDRKIRVLDRRLARAAVEAAWLNNHVAAHLRAMSDKNFCFVEDDLKDTKMFLAVSDKEKTEYMLEEVEDHVLDIDKRHREFEENYVSHCQWILRFVPEPGLMALRPYTTD